MKKCFFYLTTYIILSLPFDIQAIKLTSTSFKNNKTLDKKFAYTECGGQNNSPELVWNQAPQGTKSFVLICDDRDVPTPEPWVHWIVYNIPSTAYKLAQGESFKDIPALQGKNSWGNQKYDGPCPPKGSGTHHYHFTIYALDIKKLDTKDAPDKNQIIQSIKDHILEQKELIGLYQNS